MLPDFNSPFGNHLKSIGDDFMSYKEKSCIRFVMPQLDIDLETCSKDKGKLSAKEALARAERRYQIMKRMIFYLKFVHKLGYTLKTVRII